MRPPTSARSAALVASAQTAASGSSITMYCLHMSRQSTKKRPSLFPPCFSQRIQSYNKGVLRTAVPAAVALAAALSAQTAFFPLKDLKPGMLATGRTVFSGNRVEDFQVEILGVLENVGPKQSLILARLSGGPLEKTGVLQGMSGSPVYIGGKLVGAVAMAFPFSKEPIAGIRPIEDMVRVSGAPSEPLRRAKVSLESTNLTAMLPKPEVALSGEMRMVDIATPVWFGGFTRATIEQFAPQLRALGLEPRQGAP